MKFLKGITNNPDSKTGALFGISAVASGFVSMVIGIVIIRWIEPGVLGIWQSLSIIQLYVPFLELGVPNGLNRELPYLYGKGDKATGIRYAQTAQFFMILMAGFLFVSTILTVGVLMLKTTDWKVVAGVGTVGLLLTNNAYQRYLTVTYRSAQSFLSLAKLYWVQVAGQLVLLPLVWRYEYYGLLVYTFLAAFIFTGAMHFNRPIKAGPQFTFSYLKHLITTGLPVFIMGYLRGIANSFNRVVLLLKGGTLAVGLFTPVNAIGTLIIMLPGVLGNYFFPKMNYLLGATKNPKQLWPMVIKIHVILIFFSIPFIGIVWLCTPYIVSTYFEKYQQAIVPMQLFSVNFIFSGTLVSHNVIYAVKAYTLGYFFIAAELLLRFVLPYGFVHFGEGDILALSVYGVLSGNAILFLINIVLIKIALSYSSP